MNYLKGAWNWWSYNWDWIKVLCIVVVVIAFFGWGGVTLDRIGVENWDRRRAEYRKLTHQCLDEQKEYYCKALLREWYLEQGEK